MLNQASKFVLSVIQGDRSVASDAPAKPALVPIAVGPVQAVAAPLPPFTPPNLTLPAPADDSEPVLLRNDSWVNLDLVAARIRTASFEGAASNGNITAAPGTGPLPGDDPLLYRQWYIDKTGLSDVAVDLNVRPVWDGGGGRSYTGAGVHIGIVDSLVESDHPDLAANYDASKHLDGLNYDYTASGHGTAVAGIIAAGKNGIGITGIAYGATITSAPVIFSGSVIQDHFGIALAHARDFDVVNMSLGGTSPFDTWETRMWFASNSALYKDAADNGRNGLGTILVNGAGNNRDYYWLDANMSNFQNQRYNITVGAVGQDGFAAEYTSEGANVLVVAPSKSSYFGHWVTTTDKAGIYGYNDGYNTSWDPVSLDYTTRFGGTSASTPMVSAIVALMLEANPDLGWRDVRDILAFSARQTGSQVGDVATYFERYAWKVNGSDTVNGTGLHFNQNYGFGLVDALAAVRLAESWTRSRTSSDEVSRAATVTQEVAIPQDYTPLEFTFEIAAGVTAQTIRLYVDLTARLSREIQIKLISPLGTESLIIDRQGSPLSIYGTGGTEWTPWTFTSNNFVGEDTTGTWRMIVLDTGGLQMDSTFHSATLTVYGDAATDDSDYIYTNEFGVLTGMDYGYTITDTLGNDTINAAAVTAASVLDLRGVAPSRINGMTVTIAPGTVLENAWGGDGGDIITGNTANNRLHGMRGKDSLNGGAGDDVITGGSGDDIINGGAGNDDMQGGDGIDKLSYTGSTAGVSVDLRLTSAQNTLGAGIDKISGFENLEGSDRNDLLVGNNGDNALSARSGDDSVRGGLGSDRIYAGQGADTIEGNEGNDSLTGGAGADVLRGGAGTDTVYYTDDTAGVVVDLYIPPWDIYNLLQLASGGEAQGDIISGFENVTGGWGNDSLSGHEFANRLTGGAGNDTLLGREGDDILSGGVGVDRLEGGDGDDQLYGGEGADILTGGWGDDVYSVENLDNVIVELANQGTDTVKTKLNGYTLGETLENLVLTGSANISGTGNNANNVLTGNVANNTLRGGRGDDVLSGGNGDDFLESGTGFDKMLGGAGNDTYQFGSGDTVIETENGGTDLVLSSVTTISLGNALENVLLVASAWDARGNSLNNGMIGNGLANGLEGGGGEDTIDGKAGADIINGGKGADVLSGGADNDTFVFKSVVDSTMSQHDRITDFETIDTLDLLLIDAKISVAKDQAFTLVSAFSGQEGELLLTYDTGTDTTTLTADTNGDQLADFMILINGNHTAATGWLL